MVDVDPKVLEQLQKDMARMEREREEDRAKIAGLEELAAQTADTVGKASLREKKTFEPKFRTVRLRKYPVAGKELDFVVGWTNKGAYQEVDRTGVRPEIVDFIDIIFLGEYLRHQKALEKGEKSVLKAEKIKLLELMNKGEQVFCKILERDAKPRTEPTGEVITVSTFDPQHGLVSTGEEIDGYVTYSDLRLKVQIPGQEDVWVDATYCN